MDATEALPALATFIGSLVAGTYLRRAIQRTKSPPKRDGPTLLDRRLRFAGGLLDWRQLQTGMLITGQVGSGKTSAMTVLLRELLLNGCGMFLPASKPGEGERYLDLCRKAGREDVVVINHDAKVCVNFFQALSRGKEAATEALMLASGFDQLAQVLSRGSEFGGDNARYWQSGYERMLRNALLLCLLAGETPSIRLVIALLQSAPATPERVKDPQWRAGTCNRLLAAAYEAAQQNPSLRADHAQVEGYWLREYPNIPAKSRGTFEAMILGPADLLSRGVASRILGSDRPTLDLKEVVSRNGIIVSLLSFGADREMAVAVNTGLKYLLQLEVLARRAAEDTLPFCHVLDEYQTLLSSFDMEYASLQRSSRGPMLCATQGVESIHALFPGQNGKSRVGGLIGNLGVQLFCSPTPDTAKHLIELVGQGKKTLIGGSAQAQAYQNPMELIAPGPSQATGSFNQSYVPLVTQRDLRRLRTGGGSNGNVVDFYAVLAGREPRLASIRQEG